MAKRPKLDELANLVKTVARDALLPRSAARERSFKPDGSIVTAADLVVQRRLMAELRVRYPDFACLAEEMDEAEQAAVLKSNPRGLWCLDPLDGTSNFAAGFQFYGVSLALMVDRLPYLGVVYDPVRNECFSAARGQGAWLNGTSLRLAPAGLPLRASLAVVDFKRLPKPLAAALVTHPPFSSQRNLGSVALEWCWLAAGRFHTYLHGRQKLWDYAAGALILEEAGGVAETLEGEALFAPELQSRSVLAAGDTNLFAEWKSWLNGQPSESSRPV